ncbi:hypothetical protein [Brachybacterium sp. ACRRE]|uniref:hypothetical protein n=1 Tax=Brachybacterium sp. ACRRE TaxID=2918184 RepID=UPI001EF16517|nr:hypothetical protein [Brachybacterium sp. ACRRE]MCG7311358.1 hypothetical protein [Brachybacterium sp. ACRRE]
MDPNMHELTARDDTYELVGRRGLQTLELAASRGSARPPGDDIVTVGYQRVVVVYPGGESMAGAGSLALGQWP